MSYPLTRNPGDCPKLSCGQASDWYTHTDTQTDTGNDNNQRPKLASGKKGGEPHWESSFNLICKIMSGYWHGMMLNANNPKICTGFSCVISSVISFYKIISYNWICVIIFSISFRDASHDCPSASEVTLKNIMWVNSSSAKLPQWHLNWEHNSSSVRASYGVSFGDSISDLYPGTITTVMYAISCYIELSYNDT